MSRALHRHAFHVACAAAVFVGAHVVDAALDVVFFRACAAAFVYVSCFAVFHDAAHGALGLSRRHNDVVIALSTLPLLFSGHAQRSLHLRHHARPLADDDVEGRGAASTLLGSLLLGPRMVTDIYVEGWRAVPRSLRGVVVAEFVGAVVVACALVAAGAGYVVAVDVVLLLTMGLWASYLPHHVPRPLAFLAEKLLWTRHPLVLSFLFHQEHHDHPRVPCGELHLTASS